MSIMCVLLGFHTIEVVISTPSILSDNLQRGKKRKKKRKKGKLRNSQ